MPVLQAEAIGQIRGDVVFASRDVDVERAGLAKGNDPRIEPVNERPERKKIELARVLTDGKAGHGCSAESLSIV